MTTPLAPLTLRVRSTPTHPRQTPLPADRRFGDHLATAADTVGRVAASLAGAPELAAVRVATAATGPQTATSLPQAAGGPTVPSAWNGGAAEAALGGGSPLGGLGSTDASIYYLQLQERVSAENRRYTTLSNLMKARHDTAKVAINNIG